MKVKDFVQERNPRDQVQNRLLVFAAVFLALYALILTLAPAVRLRSWDADLRWTHWIGFAAWLGGTWLANLRLQRRLTDRDPLLFPTAAFLTGWGLLTIWRLDSGFGLRQTIWLLVSLAFFLWLIEKPGLSNLLQRYKYVLLFSGLAITAMTLVFGTYPGGTGPRLWLGCCGVYFQPSELLKLLFVLFLAAYLASSQPIKTGLIPLIAPTLVLLISAIVLLLIQRDLGTAILFTAIYTVVIYLATEKKRILGISALILLTAGLTGYLTLGIIQTRVNAWINPWKDATAGGYQVIQSLIAIGAGGTFGRGPGLGSPSLVPVAHSDFIFAAIAEETGLVGSLGLLGLIGLLLMRGLRTASRASSSYQRFLAAGITAYLGCQSILIIGGNLRALPLTGVTLPFLSYGGSSLLIAYVALAFLLNASNQIDEQAEAKKPTTAYLIIAGLLLASLAVLGFLAGYWGYYRSRDLQTRNDNARRVINDRYVRRGAILDRSGRIITASTGEPGNYTRTLVYPPLSPVVGYSNIYYGQAGLEESYDGYLRGEAGTSASELWSNHLIYSQTPPGLDIRLSIDLTLQEAADRLLFGRIGAIILLDASSGDILAVATSPTFDANHLAENWQTWASDPSGPFLNRAVQGKYLPGASMGVFLLPAAEDAGIDLSKGPQSLDQHSLAGSAHCAFLPGDFKSWTQTIANGCPAPGYELLNALEGGLNLFSARLNWNRDPDLPISRAPSPSTTSAFSTLLGPVISPLQMALPAAAISTNGEMPAPRLVTAIHTPQSGWVALQPGEKKRIFSENAAGKTARALAASRKPYWEAVSEIRLSQDKYAWYISGTLPQWPGTPLALAVVVENADAVIARFIGQQMMDRALNP